MIKLLLPLLVAAAIGLVAYQASAWRLGRMLDSRSRPLRDPAINAHAARMARELGLSSLEVRVFDDPSMNGLAAPDGRIFITQGFLDAYRAGKVSAEEIASVIAHELGHVDLGHSRRRMADFSGHSAFRVGLMLLLGRFVPVIGPWVGALIANFASAFIAARLSRRDEYEADAFAAALLCRSGVGVAPQIALLRKLAVRQPRTQAPAWLMSHPAAADRVTAIEDFARRWRVDGT